MSFTIYIVSAISVFFFSGLLAMAGLGAAFIFVPLFYYLGVPLAEAVPTALLLNVVSMFFATVNYYRGGLINWRIGLPIMIMAVLLAPLGAHTTPFVDKRLFLGMFSVFLVFAGLMMLFYKAKSRSAPLRRTVETGAGITVGSVAGFLGGLLGVGGGNFIVPVLNWIGIDTKIAAGTTAMVVVCASFVRFSRPCNSGRFKPYISWNNGCDECPGLHRRFAVDENKNFQRPIKKDHRRAASVDRSQDDFRCNQINKPKGGLNYDNEICSPRMGF